MVKYIPTTSEKLIYNIKQVDLYISLEDFEMVSMFCLRIENSINTLLRDIYLSDNKGRACIYN